jgi:hypothetical protein
MTTTKWFELGKEWGDDQEFANWSIDELVDAAQDQGKFEKFNEGTVAFDAAIEEFIAGIKAARAEIRIDTATAEGRFMEFNDKYGDESYEAAQSDLDGSRRQFNAWCREHNIVLIDSPLFTIETIAEASDEYGISEDTIRKICQNELIPTRKSGATFLMLRSDIEKYLLSANCEVYEYQSAWAVRTPAHSLIGLTKAQAWQIAFQYGRSAIRYQAAIEAANVTTTPDVDMNN